MTGGIVLAPGHKLVTHDAQAFCTLGFIVETADGKCIGLTSRHILESETDPRIYDAVTGTLVGTRINLPVPDDALENQFFEQIGAFEIALEEVSFDPTDLRNGAIGIAEPQSVIGKMVFKVGDPCDRVPALAIGYGGSIGLEDGRAGTVVVYHNVLEISFQHTLDGSDGDPAGPREAGSLVVDADGSAIGLMIAGDSKTCYVAALSPFLRFHGLSIVSPVNEEDGVDESDLLEDLSVDYRGAMIGANQLRSDLRIEGVDTPDPHDEPLTRKQLDMLEFEA